MPTIDSLNGVETANIDEINGIGKANIDGVNGNNEVGAPVASRWLIGAASGLMYSTTAANAGSGWAELVDLGSNAYKTIAIGRDSDGEGGKKRWMLHASNNTNEIAYIDADGDMTDSGNWTEVDYSTAYKATDYGPHIVYGNGVWITGGFNVDDGDSQRTIMRSTDGGANWTSIDHDTGASPQDVSQKTYAVAHKGGNSSLWIMSQGAQIFNSTDNGASWTHRKDLASITGVGGGNANREVRSIAYDGNGRWIAVLETNKILTSDNDGVAWTLQTSGVSGTWSPTCVLYANLASGGLWIVSHQNGRLQKSSDGETWTPIWNNTVGQPLDTDWDTSTIFSMATDHHTIVICGSNGKIAHSANGSNWTVLDPAIDGLTGTTYRAIACDVIAAGRGAAEGTSF